MQYVFSGQKMYKLIHLFMCSGMNNHARTENTSKTVLCRFNCHECVICIDQLMQTIHYPFVFGFE